MPIRGTLSTRGFDVYLEQLAQAGKNVDAHAAEALLAGGTVMLTGMQQLVPVDRGELKAELRIVGPHQDGNFTYLNVGLIDAPKEIQVYGTVQEFGSPSKNIPAQSYIRAGFDKVKARAMKAIKASLIAAGVASK